jgi:hypothetical protein
MHSNGDKRRFTLDKGVRLGGGHGGENTETIKGDMV